MERLTLDNGLRVVVLPVAGSKHVSIFTFLPMGLAADGPGQAQWSHLVEHLVIRSTIPAGSRQANAETLPDHMRLDFYGSVDNWREGLSHHARWLAGVPFGRKSLAAEKANVLTECDAVARNFATHKFAMAAWAQGCRHASKHAALKADVTRARLEQIQRYRDNHLAVLPKALVCVVGGVNIKTLKPAVAKRLGTIRSSAKAPEPVKLEHADRDMTWDLDARHLVLTWPIPSLDQPDHPALMAAGGVLAQRLLGDTELKKMTGVALAGTDLVTPEGSFFYVSACLRPGASFDEVSKKIHSHLQQIRAQPADWNAAAMLGRQLATTLRQPPDIAAIRDRAPTGISAAMMEGNLGLQWGMQEFRYGAHRQVLAGRLAALNAQQVQKAVNTHLAEHKCARCTLRPAEPTKQK
ncbi:MAG: hypothetical protein AMJ81_11340 [Phycisphaerae bacterium SM23_33]|nr:MAG: hypothetical protein AMJ81_11340 [Phycisphaerae bacterium SM23_33]